MENLSLPNEIVLQILGYLSLGELIQCARVSKRFNSICKDNSLSYGSSMSVMKDLPLRFRKKMTDFLIANCERSKNLFNQSSKKNFGIRFLEFSWTIQQSYGENLFLEKSKNHVS